MPQNLLARVRLWTIVVSLVTAGGLVFAVSFDFGLGVFLTALWAVTGLLALERLLRAAVVPPGAPRNLYAVFIWAIAKITVYGVAIWVLFYRPLPPLSHAVGFTLLMVVLVVLGTRARSDEIRRDRLPERRGKDASTES